MSKVDHLRSMLGRGLSESVGVREGEDTMPHYQTDGGSVPRTNYIRSRDTGDIELHEVMPDPDQPRKEFDEDEIRQLSESIKKFGLLQPIRVRWCGIHNKWLIVAGERRYRAHQMAGLERIRCTFVDQIQEMTVVRSQQIIENVLREDLTGMELARALKQLQDDNGWSAKQVSEELNISKGKVSKALALLKLPEDLQEQVESGAISPATGYELSRVKDGKKQKEMAEQAVAGHIRSTDAAKSNSSKRKARKTTNETFRTADGVRVVISSRRDVGEQGIIDALLEVADTIRQRRKNAA